MTCKYFGTDGIRGRANTHPMTADMALKVAMAAARVLRRGNGQVMNRVVIGKDTRLSGYMIEEAMASGFVAMGMDVVLVGPVPTPAIAMLIRTLRCDAGVMISASHNPFEDNGIKLFGADGFKLDDDLEDRIEGWIDDPALLTDLPEPGDIGQASRLEDAPGRYIEFVKSAFPRGKTLEGMKIVVDCAHGAAYKIAPQILWELEADVVTIGAAPNGRNINAGCGATDTAALCERVIAEGADIGLALDGDADRLILVDERGQVIDGDQIMALLAGVWQDQGRLSGHTLVTTVMSNLGLERYLKSRGLDLVRTPVGDRHVVERMRASGYNLGGEQSGHIILTDYGTTGDGLMAGLQVLAVLTEMQAPASEILSVFPRLPQILKNVRFDAGRPLDDEDVRGAIERAEAALSGQGRLLVRASGTEPVIRVMAEGDDEARISGIVEDVCATIKARAGGGA